MQESRGKQGMRAAAPGSGARHGDGGADPALDPLNLETQLIDGVDSVMGGPPDRG